MPTLTVPPAMPTSLSRGALNGQAADASTVEAMERAIPHLLGFRRFSIPLWCHPRTVTNGVTHQLRVRRQPWTRGAVLYVTYSTITPWDYWRATVGGDVATALVTLPGSADFTVGGASEAALPFVLGDGSNAAAGDVNITLSLVFQSRDPAFVGAVNADATFYSAFLAVDAVQEITG